MLTDPIRRGRIAAVVCKDLLAIRRSKAIVLPMLIVPTLLMVVMPLGLGIAARAQGDLGADAFISALPSALADEIRALPANEQLLVLVLGYLLAPLFLIVPLMVSAVIAADTFAGEKERRTLETLLHLPIADRDLYVAKLLTGFLPALAISWIGFAVFAVVANVIAWPVVERIFVPTGLWLVVIIWIAPAIAALGLGVMVRVSARAKTAQEANQLGGAVILPLIVVMVGQSTGLLLVSMQIAVAVGALLWVIAIWLNVRGARRFTRERLAI